MGSRLLTPLLAHAPPPPTSNLRSELEAAVRFCCAVQTQLLYLPWPEAVLSWEGCRPEHDGAGRLLACGLTMQMGVTWGRPDSRKRLGTGRADYFGSLANMAARIMGTAPAGHVLLQGSPALHQLGRAAPAAAPVAMPAAPAAEPSGSGSGTWESSCTDGRAASALAVPCMPVARFLDAPTGGAEAGGSIMIVPVGRFDLKVRCNSLACATLFARACVLVFPSPCLHGSCRPMDLHTSSAAADLSPLPCCR